MNKATIAKCTLLSGVFNLKRIKEIYNYIKSTKKR